MASPAEAFSEGRDRDADYYYYTHGPLARTELGDKKVQGQDYAYTILGWIKGVNSEILAGTNDIGKDGVDDASTTGSYKPSTPDIHAQVASDVFGYSLGYFSGDYSPINSSIIPADLFTANTASASYLSTYGPNLYNGNISHMVTTITDPTTLTVMPQLTAYRYDQLNRVKNMRAYRDISSNAWGSGSTYNGIYETKIAYDPNGNITGMYRNGNLTASLLMDSLSYKYNVNTNKLNYVRDRMSNATAHSSSYTNDIDDQTANNYDYDAIGNLIKDAQEYINPASSPSGIEWNVYGKITKVTRTTDATCQLPDLEFTYDAAGNRIMKLKKPRVNGVLQASSTWEYTYYVRDAQGNVLATYKRPGNNNSTIWLDNQYMYGSSRLGMIMRNVDITSASAPSTPYYRTIGEKYFELSNHLGNILSTVTDRKKANDIYTFTNVGAGSGSYTYNSTFNSYLFVGAGNGSYNRSSGTDGWSDYYTADIKSMADYGVWGDELDGRTASSNSYRYGFNGKEKDDEMKGVSGSSYDFGARIYDPRLGRWYSTDNVVKPELSPYQFGKNSPLMFIDPDGNDEFYFNSQYNAYIKSKKFISLSDGKSIFKVPTADRIVAKPGNHKYYYQVGINKELNQEDPYSWDEKLQKPVPNYITSPKYVQVNSPMSIKGGDAGKGEKLTIVEDFEASKGLQMAKDFANKHKPSSSATYDPQKLWDTYKAGLPGGGLDFKAQMNLDQNSLYNINGVYYNANEAGNYFFGYALASMNFNEADAEFIAHFGAEKGGRKFDEPWELDALLDGYNYYLSERRACGDKACEPPKIDMYTNPNTEKK